METNNHFLKKWYIINDSDKKSKFLIRLYYDNVIHVSSLYKVKDSFKVFYVKEYNDVGNYLSKTNIGDICIEMYEETMKRIENYDKFIDMMADTKHIEFIVDNKKKK